jgi:hypothetical protein
MANITPRLRYFWESSLGELLDWSFSGPQSWCEYFWRSNKPLAHAGIRTLDRPTRRIVTMQTTLSRIPCIWSIIWIKGYFSSSPGLNLSPTQLIFDFVSSCVRLSFFQQPCNIICYLRTCVMYFTVLPVSQSVWRFAWLVNYEFEIVWKMMLKKK